MKFLRLPTCIIAALILAGCGGGNNSNGSDDGSVLENITQITTTAVLSPTASISIDSFTSSGSAPVVETHPIDESNTNIRLADIALNGQSITIDSEERVSEARLATSVDLVQLIGCDVTTDDCAVVSFGVSEEGDMLFSPKPNMRYIPLTRGLYE